MTQQDYLSRQPFIDLLKSVITHQQNNPSGYSFAIDGEWGSGKTWVLNELEKQLAEDLENKYLIFHYNAWENDFYDEPLVAILSVIVETLKKQKQSLKEKEANSKIISSSISTLTKVASSIIEKKYNINPNEIIDSIKESGKAIIDVKLSKSDFNQILPLENALFQIKSIIQKLSEKFHILLIVDELDRCLPEYAIKVLERLHHIYNEMSIIQILAINKSVLVDSISTVFGKNYSNTDNHDKWNTFFADSYLQKFLDVSIPLPAGTLDSRLGILNGLEKNYVPYIRPTNCGQEFIKVDEEFLISFITTLMDGVERRLQEKIFRQVELCHKLTLNNEVSLNQEQCTYAILIYEIISCICKYIFHAKEVCKLSNNGQAYTLDLFSNLTDYIVPDTPTYIKFQKNLNSFLSSPIKYSYLYNGKEERILFEIIDTKTYMLAFFTKREDNYSDLLQNVVWKQISKDKVFLNRYDEIMNVLV